MKASLLLTVLALVGSIASAGCSVTVDINDNGCKYTDHREATLALAGAKSIRVKAGAGSLDVRGQRDLTRVRATGTACANSQDLLDQVQLKTERAGDEIIVTAIIPSAGVGSSPKLDLQVDVPDNLAVTVEDPSGTADISHVASLRMKKGSGTTRITDMAGAVDLEASSGEKTLEKVAGAITVEDGSGTLIIRDAAGTVDIREKSSGELTVDGAGGAVNAGRLGSGSALFRNVKGELVIDSKSSGQVRIDGVEQNVLIRSSGSGSVDVVNVKGNLTIERKSSGSITHRNVDGTVRVPAK